jgi:hypothetical protein
MPSSTSVLDEARGLVQKRLAELDEERKRLERALAHLGGKVAHRSPGRPRGSKSASAASTSAKRAPRKRRKRRGGTRGDHAVKLIEKSPGMGASEIAKTDEDQA